MSSAIRSFPSKSATKVANKEFDLSLIRYTTPARQDMAVLLAFFNPAHSFRIVQNLYTVKQVLELANIPVFIGEVAYNDNPFVLQSSPRTYQYRTNSIMFYKENIMAQIASQLPETFTKLILLDADILFVDPDWYTKVSHALDTRVVVQPFFRAFQLDITFHVGSTKHSRLSDGDNNHDGYAWAFQRSWLHNHPLFEYSLIGGGDTSIYNMAIKHRNSAAIGYVNVDILHLPHGTLRNRQYESRHDKITTILARNKLSSLADAVVRTSSGIFEWKEQYRIAMNDVLLTYFKSRDDDGI